MKKIALCFLMTLFMGFSSHTQVNIVPNPSFEEHTGCVYLDTDCDHWMSFRDTPDYWHYCQSNSYETGAGFQVPRTGEAYVGFFAYDKNNPNVREYFGVPLIAPLVIGETYHVVFYAVSGYKKQAINIMHNNIGALFTTYAYYDPFGSLPHPNFAHVNELEIISDTLNWTKISGSFVADLAYTHMVIGNFFDNDNTDTLQHQDSIGNFRSYYFIDDVCVSTDSCLCDPCEVTSLAIPNVFTPNGDGINDDIDFSVFPFELKIYNRWGSEVYSTLEAEVWKGNDKKGNKLTEGVYFYQTDNNETGFIHLIRGN